MGKVRVYEESGVLRVILSNPAKRNVIDEEVIEEVTKIFLNVNSKDLRVAVIEGEGEFFCAGGDLRWMIEKGKLPFEENLQDALNLVKMYEAIWNSDIPVITKVKGGAYGGGVGFLAASDIVVAEENARFRLPEVKIGLVPAVISVFLKMRIGPKVKILALTGMEFDAKFAKEISLVDIVVPREKLDEVVSDLLQEIHGCSPYAIKRAKELMRFLYGRDLDIHKSIAAEFLALTRSNPDTQLRLQKFFERKK